MVEPPFLFYQSLNWLLQL